jgi:hypothetical protein
VAVARLARSAESRPIFGCSSTMSRKMSAWRRNSAATIGGCVEMVETTVTHTPRRCTASTSERKSPSPENNTMWSIEPGTYLVLPVDLFVAQLVACAASFYAHVYFDKE